jgi:uncharacterized membrane protein HdeD (DUF308 family)
LENFNFSGEIKVKQRILPGIILIAIGGVILVYNLDIIDLGWRTLVGTVMLLIGISIFIGAFKSSDRSPVFPGTYLSLTGLFFITMDLNLINDDLGDMWPMFIIILGIAFLVTFAFKPRELSPLINAIIFTSLGIIFLLSQAGILEWHDVWHYFGQYWPVILILIGLSLLLKSIRKKYVTD